MTYKSYPHNSFCNCFDCMALPEHQLLNHVDGVETLSANDSKVLFAPAGGITIYISDGTTKKIPEGGIVGVADQIITASGTKMYSLVPGGSLPKGGKVSYYAFNPTTAISNTKIVSDAKAQTTESQSYVADSLKDKIYSTGGWLDQAESLGGDLKTVLMVVAVIVAVIAAAYVYKAFK